MCRCGCVGGEGGRGGWGGERTGKTGGREKDGRRERKGVGRNVKARDREVGKGDKEERERG